MLPVQLNFAVCHIRLHRALGVPQEGEGRGFIAPGKLQPRKAQLGELKRILSSHLDTLCRAQPV